LGGFGPFPESPDQNPHGKWPVTVFDVFVQKFGKKECHVTAFGGPITVKHSDRRKGSLKCRYRGLFPAVHEVLTDTLIRNSAERIRFIKFIQIVLSEDYSIKNTHYGLKRFMIIIIIKRNKIIAHEPLSL
jgi:hypothetical protein